MKNKYNIAFGLLFSFSAGIVFGDGCSGPKHAFFAKQSHAPNGDLNGDGLYPDIIIWQSKGIGNDLIPLYKPSNGIFYKTAELHYQRKDSEIDYQSIEDKLND